MYSNLVHHPHVTITVQASCAKMIFQLVDIVQTKDTPESATATIMFIMQTCSEKLKELVFMADDVFARMDKQKEKTEGSSTVDVTFIEKDRPISGATYMTDNPEGVIKGKLSDAFTL